MVVILVCVTYDLSCTKDYSWKALSYIWHATVIFYASIAYSFCLDKKNPQRRTLWRSWYPKTTTFRHCCLCQSDRCHLRLYETVINILVILYVDMSVWNLKNKVLFWETFLGKYQLKTGELHVWKKHQQGLWRTPQMWKEYASIFLCELLPL